MFAFHAINCYECIWVPGFNALSVLPTHLVSVGSVDVQYKTSRVSYDGRIIFFSFGCILVSSVLPQSKWGQYSEAPSKG